VAKIEIHTKEHGHLILDDVTSLVVEGLFFTDASAIVKLFEHPERVVRLSRRGERNDMPCFEILSSPSVIVDDRVAQSVKALYGIADDTVEESHADLPH
jgi:hypothetical protein